MQEDHSIPNVALYIFYKIGSRNERPGTTGISHFFEHMMFNGAKKYGPKKFDETMEAAGGSNNASTSNDLTIYQDWFPRSAIETIFIERLVAGAILAFALSFDEIVVTTFTAGPTVQTLPIWIFGNLFRPNQAPVINVVAAALTLVAIIPVWLAQRFGGDPATTRV